MKLKKELIIRLGALALVFSLLGITGSRTTVQATESWRVAFAEVVRDYGEGFFALHSYNQNGYYHLFVTDGFSGLTSLSGQEGVNIYSFRDGQAIRLTTVHSNVEIRYSSIRDHEWMENTLLILGFPSSGMFWDALFLTPNGDFIRQNILSQTAEGIEMIDALADYAAFWTGAGLGHALEGLAFMESIWDSQIEGYVINETNIVQVIAPNSITEPLVNQELQFVIQQTQGHWVDRRFFDHREIGEHTLFPLELLLIENLISFGTRLGLPEVEYPTNPLEPRIGIYPLAPISPVLVDPRRHPSIESRDLVLLSYIYLHSLIDGVAELRFDTNRSLLNAGSRLHLSDWSWLPASLQHYSNRRIIINTNNSPINQITYYYGGQRHEMVRTDAVPGDVSRYLYDVVGESVRLRWQVNPWTYIPGFQQTDTLFVYRSQIAGEIGQRVHSVRFDNIYIGSARPLNPTLYYLFIDDNIVIGNVYYYSLWQIDNWWEPDFDTLVPIQIAGHWQMRVDTGQEVEMIAPAIVDIDAVYIHTPSATWLSFTPSPATLQLVTTPVQAVSAIQELVSSLAPAERDNPIFLTNTTLHIENLLARGTTTGLASNGVISWTGLQEGAATASEILAEAMQTLADYEVSPLRRLRQNIFFQQQGNPRELSVSFGEIGNKDDTDFDNVVVQSGFASVTIHRDFVTDGTSLEVSLIDATEEGEEVGSSALTDFSQIQDNLILALTSINLQSLEIVMYLWAALVAIGMALLWILLSTFKKYLRLWVPLSVVSLAIIANAYTLVLLGSEQQLPGSLQDLVISVDMTADLALTLSLPVDSEGRDLVLLNQEGYIIPTRYNPSTGMLDSRISSSGYYSVVEHIANFADIEHSAAIMQEAILWLGTRGIMAGSVEGNFYPNQPITRAEFTATVVNAFNLLDLGAQHNFLDVLPQDWFYTAVASAYEQDLVEGFVDQTFRPTWDMAKGQLIVVIGRILTEQMDYYIPENVDQLLQDFTDIEDLPSWAIEAIALTNATNILIHRYDGLFAANTVMTRGDAAIVLYRLFSRIW